jgi:hypothetical protein
MIIETMSTEPRERERAEQVEGKIFISVPFRR